MKMPNEQRTRIDCVSEANQNLSGVGRARIAFLRWLYIRKYLFTAMSWEGGLKFSRFPLGAKARLPGKGQKYNRVFHKIAILLFLN